MEKRKRFNGIHTWGSMLDEQYNVIVTKIAIKKHQKVEIDHWQFGKQTRSHEMPYPFASTWCENVMRKCAWVSNSFVDNSSKWKGFKLPAQISALLLLDDYNLYARSMAVCRWEWNKNKQTIFHPCTHKQCILFTATAWSRGKAAK